MTEIEVRNKIIDRIAELVPEATASQIYQLSVALSNAEHIGRPTFFGALGATSPTEVLNVMREGDSEK